MKKKLLTRAFGLFLSAAITISSVPVNASPVPFFSEEEANVEVVDINQAVTEDEDVLEQDVTEVESETDNDELSLDKTVPLDALMAMDIDKMSYEEIDEAFNQASIEEAGLYFSNLSEEELAKIKSILGDRKAAEYVFDVDENGEETGCDYQTFPYVDYCLEQYKNATENPKAFTSKTGENLFAVHRYNYECTGNVDSLTNYTSTKLSYTVSNLSTSAAQNVTIKANNDNLKIDGNAMNVTGKKIALTDATSTAHCMLSFNYTYTHGGLVGFRKWKASITGDVPASKRDGRAASTITLDNTDGSTNTISGSATINLGYDAGMGYGSATTSNATFHMYVSKNRYTIDYSGNGATSGSVGSMSVDYGEAGRVLAQNGFTRQYTVTYDGQGGTPDKSSDTATYQFAGWSVDNGIGDKNAGDSASGWTNTSMTFTASAKWTGGSITVPNATRKGYTFNGWSGVGAAGTAYAPTQNTTLLATWSPITYTIRLKDAANTAEPTKDLPATYDTNAVLPNPTRTGYTFKGWKGESATYPAGNVINLTETKGTVIELTAQWEAQDVTYTVKREKETGYKTGKFEPVVKDVDGVEPEEILQAKADSKINVPAGGDIADYITPVEQLVDIAADGTTVVTFKYLAKEPNQINPNPGPNNLDKDVSEILQILKNTNISDITKELKSQLAIIYSTVTGLDKVLSEKLVETIISSSMLSELDKKEILDAIANGYITDAQKAKLIAAIQASNLSDAEKSAIIEKLNKLNNLSLEDQKLILSLLENGSSASYTINGITYTITKNVDGTISIALKSLNNEKIVTIPDSITLAGKTIAVTEISKEAFKGNTVIEKVIMGNNVTKIGDSAFEGCTSLKEVVFGPNVKEIGAKAFKGCTALTSIDIPASVLKIGNEAFMNCTALKVVTLHDGLMQIGSKAFYNCKSLTKIKIPRSVVKILNQAFAKCIKLKSVTFAADSLLLTMGNGTFMDCKALTKIKLPNRLTVINKKTFYNCTSLATCTGGTSVTRIGVSAFENCKKLKSFTVQGKVQIIYAKAFYNCKALKTITIKSKALTSVGANAAKKCNKKLKIKCPDNKVQAYNKLWKGKM